MGNSPPQSKTLRWHVDYLLEDASAILTHVLLVRTARRIEQPLAERLADLDCCAPIAQGLGASDHPGGTHLFRIRAGSWQQVCELATNLAEGLEQ